MPPHSGQAPYGLLNENIRGETSGKEMPQSAQARRSEKTMGSVLVLLPPSWLPPSWVGRSDSALDCFAGGRVPPPPDPPTRVMSEPPVLLARLPVLLLRTSVLPSSRPFALPASAPLSMSGSTWT